MSDETEGASLPDGIEVDEAAAYFGVFKSSDALHQMMEMPRMEAFERFFALLSDLVLKPGEFDFKLASERLECEGGEIYFLVAGHLGVMSLPEQLSLALTEGQFSQSDADKLQPLADPMRLLKLFAIAYQTGGPGEPTKYLKGMESIFGEPVRNKDGLLVLAHELQSSFDVSGHVVPISCLASTSASTSQVEAADVVPLPALTPQLKPEPVKQVEQFVATKPEPISVPLPREDVSIPLPNLVQPKAIIDDRKDTEKTDDAFSGAFSISEPEPAPKPEPVTKPEPVPKPEPVTKPEPVIVEEVQIVPEELIEKEIVDEIGLEEAFAAADADDSGGLSVEEVAQATGLDIKEAAKLHAEADIDGDGQVTLEELKAKPEVVIKMALPKPVRPVSRPIQPEPSPAQLQQQALQAQAIEQQKLLEQQRLQQQAWQQQQLQQQQLQQQQLQQQQLQQQQLQQQQQQQQQQQPQQPQQGWSQPAQPMQPTIRSGIACRGCRIGVDPNWKFCPVCGSQNR